MRVSSSGSSSARASTNAAVQSSSIRERKSGSSGGREWYSSHWRSSLANLYALRSVSSWIFSSCAGVILWVCMWPKSFERIGGGISSSSDMAPKRPSRWRSTMTMRWSSSVGLLNEGCLAMRAPRRSLIIFLSIKILSMRDSEFGWASEKWENALRCGCRCRNASIVWVFFVNAEKIRPSSPLGMPDFRSSLSGSGARLKSPAIIMMCPWLRSLFAVEATSLRKASLASSDFGSLGSGMVCCGT